MPIAETMRALIPESGPSSAHGSGELRRKAPRDPSIDYLRAFVTVLVLLAHCGLAYSHTARAQVGWNALVPIVDFSGASGIFDYIFNFDDVCLMALMFFISALFAWPSLSKHGVAAFVWDRFTRLGVPFLGAIVISMPLAYYAAWQMAHHDGRYATFWLMLAHQHFGAIGPAWFLWVLLLLDCLLAGSYLLARARLAPLHPQKLKEKPLLAASVLLLLCAVAYLPLFARSGFQYGGWRYLVSPFLFQPSRFPTYALWCATGFVVGIAGLEHGLIARSGSLVRNWKAWTLGAVVSYNALWLVPHSQWLSTSSPLARGICAGLLWVVANVFCIFGMIAFFRAKVQHRHPMLDSLARSAYVMYLVHYIYALWSQRLLLHAPIPVLCKFAISFAATLGLSWSTGIVLARVPGLRRIL